MTRLFSIIAVGLEGLMGALVAHRQYDSLSTQVLTMAVTVLPSATMIAGWYVARGTAQTDDAFALDKPPNLSS